MSFFHRSKHHMVEVNLCYQTNITTGALANNPYGKGFCRLNAQDLASLYKTFVKETQAHPNASIQIEIQGHMYGQPVHQIFNNVQEFGLFLAVNRIIEAEQNNTYGYRLLSGVCLY